jgi:hypothetical protein
VHSVKVPDQVGLKLLLGSARTRLSCLSHPWLDACYEGRGKRWMEEVLGLSVEIVRRPPKPIPEEVARTWAAQSAPTDQVLQRSLLRAGPRGLLLRPTNGRRAEGARWRRLRTRPCEARPSAVQGGTVVGARWPRARDHRGTVRQHRAARELWCLARQHRVGDLAARGRGSKPADLRGTRVHTPARRSSEEASKLACGDLVMAGSRGSG